MCPLKGGRRGHYCLKAAALPFHLIYPNPQQEENLLDVLLLLIALLFEDTTGNIVKTFEKLEGLKYVYRSLCVCVCVCLLKWPILHSVAAKLLACSSEEITLYALKIIGKVLHHSGQK